MTNKLAPRIVSNISVSLVVFAFIFAFLFQNSPIRGMGEATAFLLTCLAVVLAGYSLWRSSSDEERGPAIDIPAVDRTEAQTGNAERAAKWDTFGKLLPGFRHDLNDHFTVVLANVAVLKQGDLTPDQRRIADNVERAAEMAANTVRKTLALFGEETWRGEQVIALKELLAEIVETASQICRTRAEVTDVDVHIETEIQDAFVRGSYQDLRQAFLNLVVNAIDAMPTGGRLRLRRVPAGEKVVISVEDTGIGISDEVQHRVFEPFFTTKAGASGLGLAVAHRLVGMYGGQLNLESRVRQGTTVSVVMPRVIPPPLRERAEASVAAGAAGHRVVVLDDNADTAKAVTEYLKIAHHEVLTFVTADAALAAIKEHPTEIGVVVTDYGLGGRLNGLTIARAVKSINPQIKVILVTGYELRSVFSEEELRHRNVDEVMWKPLKMEKLLVAVQEAVRAAGRREQESRPRESRN